MRAAVLYGPGDLRITDFPRPALERGGIEIAVAYCGLCGTDFHKYAGFAGSRPVTYPVPLGHEVSGIVTNTGQDVHGFNIGDRVTVDPNWSCGRCFYCKGGKRHLCENSRGVVKGLAQYICPPQENVYILPEGLSLRDAALTEPVACCIHGIDILDICLGETVAIIGMGAIGHIMLELCKLSGASRIIVIETVEHKRGLALDLGAALFINAAKEDAASAIKSAGIHHVDKVIECAGSQSAAQSALHIAGRGATVLLFGVGGKEAVVPLCQYDAFYKELTIKTSYINPHTTRRAIDLLNAGSLDTNRIISRLIELEEMNTEMETRRGSLMGKVLVRIGADETV